MYFFAAYRDPLDPLGENADFEDDDDGRTIVGTILFKTTDSLIRVSYLLFFINTYVTLIVIALIIYL